MDVRNWAKVKISIHIIVLIMSEYQNQTNTINGGSNLKK